MYPLDRYSFLFIRVTLARRFAPIGEEPASVRPWLESPFPSRCNTAISDGVADFQRAREKKKNGAPAEFLAK